MNYIIDTIVFVGEKIMKTQRYINLHYFPLWTSTFRALLPVERKIDDLDRMIMETTGLEIEGNFIFEDVEITGPAFLYWFLNSEYTFSLDQLSLFCEDNGLNMADLLEKMIEININGEEYILYVVEDESYYKPKYDYSGD